MYCKKNFASTRLISWKHPWSRKVKANGVLPTCFWPLPPLYSASRRHKGMPRHHFWQNHISDAKLCWNLVMLWVPWAGRDRPLVCMVSSPLCPCHPQPMPPQTSVATTVIIILMPDVWMLFGTISECFYSRSLPEGSQLCHSPAVIIPIKVLQRLWGKEPSF